MTVLAGIAKPMPTLPWLPPAVAICEFTPITLAVRVEQRAAGVAGVDRRVRLDHLVDREAVGRLDLALEARDDAGGRRAVETRAGSRSRSRSRRPATPSESANSSGLTPFAASASTFSAARSVDASTPSTCASCSSPPSSNRTCTCWDVADDVRVGDDRAVAVDQEPGAGAALRAHRDHARARGGVDGAHEVALGVARVDDRRRRRAAGRRLVVAAGDAGAEQDRRHDHRRDRAAADRGEPARGAVAAATGGGRKRRRRRRASAEQRTAAPRPADAGGSAGHMCESAVRRSRGGPWVSPVEVSAPDGRRAWSAPHKPSPCVEAPFRDP